MTKHPRCSEVEDWAHVIKCKKNRKTQADLIRELQIELHRANDGGVENRGCQRNSA